MRLAIIWACAILTAWLPSNGAAAADTQKNLKPFISVSWGDEGSDVVAMPAAPPLRSARPRVNADSWFPESEFPAEALAKATNATAILNIRLDATGKMLSCTVAEVKGDPLLYRNACQTVQKRGQFLAELDSQGVAVASTVRLQIHWGAYDPNMMAKAPAMDQTRRVDYHYPDPNLWRPASNSRYAIFGRIDWPLFYPDTAGLPAAAKTGVDIFILPDGRVGDCQIREPSESSALDQAACLAVKSAPVSFKYSKPTSDIKVSAFIRWKGKSAQLEIADYENSAGPKLADPLTLAQSDVPAGPAPQFGKAHVTLVVGPDGKPVNCAIYRSSTSDAHDRKSCQLSRDRALFVPARDGLGRSTYGSIQLVVNWDMLTAYWPADYSANIAEETTACKMGQMASCANAGNARLGGFWSRKGETAAYDAAEGIALLKLGCTGNSTASCRRLGEAYRAGNDTPAAPAFAAYYLEIACKGPEGYADDRACVALAEMLMAGEGVPKDQARAFALFEAACVGWRDDGCVGLGKAYEDGTGVAADLQKAVQIYGANCKEYQRTTCLALEKLYFAGKGVPRDQPRAIAYFDKSCRSSAMSKATSEPCLLAGLAYLNGSGVTADVQKGASYLNVACKSGIADGCAYLGTIAREGSLGRSDESVAIRLWKQALALEPGNAVALAAMRKYKVDAD
jgi:TonB family protein